MLSAVKASLYPVLSRGIVSFDNTKINGFPLIYACEGSYIKISNSIINSGAFSNALSNGSKGVIRTLTSGAEINIEGVGISGSVIVARTGIHIGEGTLIGEGCLLIDSDHHYLGNDPEISRNDPAYIRSKEIVVGKRVFIGARSIILKGVNIPDGTVIGAGSIVR